METVHSIAACLRSFAPLELAESWDNVGLLVGRDEALVDAVMTCLTITPASVAEAIEQNASLVVTHHPLPFRPLKQITARDTVGRMLLALIEARIAVYSPHTAFDSAREGINQSLAELLSLEKIQPLGPTLGDEVPVGSGRCGALPASVTLGILAGRLKQLLAVAHVQVVGALDRSAARIGIACGSGGELFDLARAAECDTFLTGEASFHRCLEAEAVDVGMILVGHYASERFAVEQLARRLGERFPQLRVWASARERDPINWV